jgi:XTP/dITP diphosphohydrolase
MKTTAAKPSIILASRNRKKSGEIADLLAPHGIEVISVADFPDVPDVVEDGETFAENAAKKAGQTAKFLSRYCLGEDSGLMVDALNGAPGIYSARYSGPGATDQSNNRKLLDELSGIPDEKRGCQYVCSVVLADPGGQIRLRVEATCRGRVANEPRGTNGFGYDPCFFIREYHRTFGELSPLVKGQLSHRARAFRRLIPRLVKLLQQEE